MNNDIRKYADEVLKTVEAITHGDTLPYAPEIQEWALGISNQIGPLSDEDDPVVLAIADCLVDILTCDGRSWDTPLWGFKEHLSRLSAAIASL